MGTQNKIEELRNHLFTRIERLNDDDLTEQELAAELQKSKAVCSIAEVLIETAKVEIQFLDQIGTEHATGFFPPAQKKLN